MPSESVMQLVRLRNDFGVGIAPAAGLWAQRTYRPRPTDDGGFYFLSGGQHES